MKQISGFELSSSSLRLTVYIGAIGTLIAVIHSVAWWPVDLAAALLLGVVYAHGLELQHEALHGIFCKTAGANRLAGSLLGLPMLTTYTDTMVRHLHHHRFVGTERDIHDRSCRDFAGWGAIIAHVLSANRLRDFVATVGAMMIGRADNILADTVLNDRSRALARTEFLSSALAMALLLAAAAIIDVRMVWWGWMVPALIVAPAVHFLMTAAEHLGRRRLSRRPEENSRTYQAPRLWCYLINYDNYHIEHHLRPAMPFRQLPAFHAERCRAAQPEPQNYWQAMSEVGRGIGICLQSRG